MVKFQSVREFAASPRIRSSSQSSLTIGSSSLPREIHTRVFPSLSFNFLALSFASQAKRPEKYHNRFYIRATFVEAGHSAPEKFKHGERVIPVSLSS